MTGPGFHQQGTTTPAGIDWRSSPVEAPHWRELVELSAIPPDLIAEEGIKSLPSGRYLPDPSCELRHVDPVKGARLASEQTRRWRESWGPGWYVPISTLDGFHSWSYKPDRPRTTTGKDGKPRIVKYELPSGARPVLYVPQRCRDRLAEVSTELVVTEGIKKTLSGAGRGLTIVGLAGVDSWTQRLDYLSLVLPDLDLVPLTARLMLIAFDSDAATNPNVSRARNHLADYIRSRGGIPLIVEIPSGPDGEKQGLDDYLAAGGDLGVLRRTATLAPETPAVKVVTGGSDGARICDGHCKTSEALREELAQFRAERELIRRKIVSPGEALALLQLVKIAASARSRGKGSASYYVPDVASRAGVSAGTLTRASNQVRRWQADPDVVGLLPFKIEDYEKNGKPRSRLVLPPTDDAGVATGSGRAMVQALTRLPRDSDRRPHGGDHRCPRHPDATVVRTRIWRCTVDGCGWVKQDRSLLGAHQDQDGPVKLTGTLRDQDGLGEVGDSEDQDGPGPPRCVKVGCIAPAVNGFICADHLVGAAEAADLIDPPPETAAEPTTRLVPWPTPPGWQPPPLAPSHHIAQGFQKRRPPDPNGGSAP